MNSHRSSFDYPSSSFRWDGHDIFFNQDLPWADAGTLEKNRATDLINHVTTAFLLDVLKGDKEAHKALLREAVKFEEVQYTTTWK